MAGAIQLHLDEHVAAAVALGLRLRGIAVTTTAEEGLAAATDEQQLAFAAGQGRVLVTHDADFLRLLDGRCQPPWPWSWATVQAASTVATLFASSAAVAVRV